MVINTCNSGEDKKLKSIIRQVEELSDKEQAELLKLLEKKKKEREKTNLEYLFGDKKAILDNLKKNHIEVEENVEMMGYNGKKVKITLPEIEGKFEEKTFEYFVSYGIVSKENFEKNPELVEKSYSIKEVGELLGAINGYMKALGVYIDGNMDYEKDLKGWMTDRTNCKAGDCLKYISGLNDWYWLKDKYVGLRKRSRVKFICKKRTSYSGEYCNFDRFDFYNDTAGLFLMVS